MTNEEIDKMLENILKAMYEFDGIVKATLLINDYMEEVKDRG